MKIFLKILYEASKHHTFYFKCYIFLVKFVRSTPLSTFHNSEFSFGPTDMILSENDRSHDMTPFMKLMPSCPEMTRCWAKIFVYFFLKDMHSMKIYTFFFFFYKFVTFWFYSCKSIKYLLSYPIVITICKTGEDKH